MSYLNERVSYLKGLAEGMQISDSTNEGKLLKAIIDVLDDIALTIDDIEEAQDLMSEQLDEIDEDLSSVEEAVFGEEDDDDDEYCCDDEIECPHCGEVIDIDDIVLNKDTKSFECPNCHKEIEVEWDCECECDDSDE
ncbi:MAG TPA: hypothetical protein GXX36_00640 [Clostridiaceae bacterium]|nr:hypothetical protein [Clostridiaceae bacterium]